MTIIETLAGEALRQLVRGSKDYPPLLMELRDAPDTLYAVGDPDTLHLPAIAIVGSRNPTSGGRDNAFHFARHLAATGFVIVSGLAEGIDAAAHEGALAVGGRTVAVLGHGLDQIYPASNGALAERILKDGALVSEYSVGTPPRRGHFPQRNRIISGLCLGTLVVEAARRSGSLITARTAGEQGREVFAIPGSIHNPMSRGCHQLIRQGARLVETADDILSELAPLVAGLMENADDAGYATTTDEQDEDYVRLVDALGFDPQTPEELAAKTGLTIEQVSSMLLILELQERIESLPGGAYSKLGS